MKARNLVARLLQIAIAAVLLGGCTPKADQFEIDTRYNVRPANIRLLFDLYHAHPQIPGGHLDKDTYSYYEITSWHSLLTTLCRGGVSSDLLLRGEITRELLEQYDLFCLYFPEDPAPPLTPSELDALEGWVRSGGGLLIAGEHHNAGYSSERLNPLLTRFGMRMNFGSVVDEKNAYSSGAWHKCFHFEDHSITKGVRAVAVRTTGAIEVSPAHPDRPVGLMASSPEAFLDDWDPGLPPAFTGDLTRQPDEPQGQFFEVAAAHPGHGRLVLVGDHNIFDNVTLRYVDNRKLALQACDWLAGGRLETPIVDRETTILIPETLRPSDIMMPDSSREGHGAWTFYTLFTVLNRHPDTIAHCTEFLEGDYSAVLVVPQPRKFARAYLDYLKQQHDRGATIVIMTDPGAGLGVGTQQVLEEFDVNLSPLPAKALTEEGTLSVGEREIGRCSSTVYSWGKIAGTVVMKFETEEEEFPLIVQYAPRIQIVLQAQMFRNRAFQTKDGYTLPREAVKPNDDGIIVYQALWAWLDSLYAPIRRSEP